MRKSDSRRWSLTSSGQSPSFQSDGTDSPASSYEGLHHTASELPLTEAFPSASSTSMAVHLGNISLNPTGAVESYGSDDSSLCSLEQRDLDSPLSPMQQTCLRSLGSPSKFTETYALNARYRERFPKAVLQMDENLTTFIEESCGGIDTSPPAPPPTGGCESAESDGTLRFARRQIAQLAQGCLEQSAAKLLSTAYFRGLDESLERLSRAAKSSSLHSAANIKELTCKLRVITSRTARLLECLEFDPDEFYSMMEKAEGEAKKTIAAADIPQYVISKLGLTKDTEKRQPSSSSEEENYDREEVPNLKQQFCTRQPTEEDFAHVKLISNGAYGAVHLVRHKATRQRFAVKRIPKSSLMLRNQVEQVFTERDILTFIDNPFVVSLYCTFETRSHLCMVLEYVEGGDCSSLLKNIGGPLPVDMARLYFAETVLALEYLHSYGVVHRDLKPDNLLVTNMGHIKLTDFGLSKMGIMSLTTNLYEGMLDKECKQFNDRQIFGTPEYIAPEVILRQGYGKPVDWWSMGIILYEFVIGCVPFFGNTPEELFSQVLSEGIEWPEETEQGPPEEARNLITALLQREPLERLGMGGPHEVKSHAFFEGLDWYSLLLQKAEFVPNLAGEDDTSYFDSRADRYCHDVSDDDSLSNDDGGGGEDDAMFRSFTSCSPRYSRVYEFTEASKGEDQQSSLQHESEDYCGSSEKVVSTELLISSAPPKPTGDEEEAAEAQSRNNSTINDNVNTHDSCAASSTNSGQPPCCDTVAASSHAMTHTADCHARLESSSFARGDGVISTEGHVMGQMERTSEEAATPSPSLNACSQDSSPTNEVLCASLEKLPLIIKKGQHGYGFTLRAIRVFLGHREISLYTLHHLVVSVDKDGPAQVAGLKPGWVITHVNNQPVQGLNHTQVIALILFKRSKVSIRSLPMEQTSIQMSSCHRRRESSSARQIAAVFASAPKAEAIAVPRDGACLSGGCACGCCCKSRIMMSSSSSSMFKKMSHKRKVAVEQAVPTAAPPQLASGQLRTRSPVNDCSSNSTDGGSKDLVVLRRDCSKNQPRSLRSQRRAKASYEGVPLSPLARSSPAVGSTTASCSSGPIIATSTNAARSSLSAARSQRLAHHQDNGTASL